MPDVLLLFVVDAETALDCYKRDPSQYGFVEVGFHRVEKKLPEHVRYGRHQKSPTEHPGRRYGVRYRWQVVVSPREVRFNIDSGR